MARGDSISISATFSGTAYSYLRPADGDEWMITHAYSSGYGLRFWMLNSSNGYWNQLKFAASPTPSSAGSSSITEYFPRTHALIQQPLKWFITYDTYFRIAEAASYHYTFMGIKTKE